VDPQRTSDVTRECTASNAASAGGSGLASSDGTATAVSSDLNQPLLAIKCCDARLLERVRTLKRSLESVDALAMDTVIKRYLGSRRNRNRRDGLRRHSAHFSSVSRDKQRF